MRTIKTYRKVGAFYIAWEIEAWLCCPCLHAFQDGETTDCLGTSYCLCHRTGWDPAIPSEVWFGQTLGLPSIDEATFGCFNRSLANRIEYSTTSEVGHAVRLHSSASLQPSTRITRHRIPASLAMPEMQNGEPENSSPFA